MADSTDSTVRSRCNEHPRIDIKERVCSHRKWPKSRHWHYPTINICVMRHVEAERTHTAYRIPLLYSLGPNYTCKAWE